MSDNTQIIDEFAGEEVEAPKARFGRKTTKPTKAKKSKPSGDNSPYLHAREEWNERYGSYIKSRNQWRAMAFGAMALAVPAVMFALYQSGQTKVVPYVVEVDGSGQPRATGLARQIAFDPDYIVEAEISDFIRNFRVVTVDKTLQLDRLNEVYAFLAPNGPAKAKLDIFYREGGNPFEVAKDKTVQVQVTNINRLSPESFNVQWVETSYDRSGVQLAQQRYQAIVTYATAPPTSEAVIRTNPLGVYVTEIDYSEVTQ